MYTLFNMCVASHNIYVNMCAGAANMLVARDLFASCGNVGCWGWTAGVAERGHLEECAHPPRDGRRFRPCEADPAAGPPALQSRSRRCRFPLSAVRPTHVARSQWQHSWRTTHLCGSPHDCFIFEHCPHVEKKKAVEAPNGVVSHRFLVQALKDQHAEDPTFHRRNVSVETSALEAGHSRACARRVGSPANTCQHVVSEARARDRPSAAAAHLRRPTQCARSWASSGTC